MPIFRQNSACARSHRSCSRLVTLARWSQRMTEWMGSPKWTTARSRWPSSAEAQPLWAALSKGLADVLVEGAPLRGAGGHVAARQRRRVPRLEGRRIVWADRAARRRRAVIGTAPDVEVRVCLHTR